MTLAVLLLSEAAPAVADIGDVVGVTASSTKAPEASHGPARLLDGDDATAFCARDKVKVRVVLTLSGPTHLDALALTLGDPAGWKQSPRVKQVFVTVREGEQTVKKIRHKWPDRDEVRGGKVTLGATGDNVVIDFDQVYAGKGLGGLCVAGAELIASEDGDTRVVDSAGLVAVVAGDERTKASLARTWKIATGDGGEPASLELGKRGTFEYKDAAADLKVTGSWRVVDGTGAAAGGRALELKVTKAKRGGKRVTIPATLAPHVARWRHGPVGEGGAAEFQPWVAYAVDETGALSAVVPVGVAP